VPDPTPRPSDAEPPVSATPSATRRADHAAIGHLTAELLPALVARLSATGLGELEVREGSWKIRLRRPADGSVRVRRSSDKASRSQPGHAGHGHAPGALEGHRSARVVAHSTNGSGGVTSPTGTADEDQELGYDPHRVVATSPAVGIYQPSPEVRAGTRVRSGDRIGVVVMLGVPQEVIAPADGLVGASLVEPGDAVEYGQQLVVIELVALSAADDDGGVEA
jgi:biotin carboxyl carrier protein